MVSRLVARLAEFSAARALPLVVLALLAAAGSAFYVARHFAIDTDSVKLISSDLPWRQREIAFDAAFPQRVDLLLAVVDGPTPELAELATARLAAALAKKPELFRTVRRPDGSPYFQKNAFLFLDIAEVQETTEQIVAAQPFLGPLAADPSLRGIVDGLDLALQGVLHGQAQLSQLATPFEQISAATEQVLAGKPATLSWRSLLTGQPSLPRELRRFILIQPKLDFSALEPGAAASDFIRSTAKALGLDAAHGVQVRLTGPVALADEEFATVAENMGLNAAITLIVVIGLLWLALHSARLILAILVTLLVGLAMTAAFGLLAVGVLNLISVAFAVLSVGLGIDFGIQFAVRYRAERFEQRNLYRAIKGAGAGVGRPLAIAAASTAAGFFALLPTDFRGMSELGLIAGVGMLVAFVLSVTLLPALIALLAPPGEGGEVGLRPLAHADATVARYRSGILAGATALALFCLAVLPRLSFDFNPMNLRSAATESVATMLDLFHDKDNNPNTIDIIRPSLAEADALAQKIGALPEVDRSLTLSSFVPENQDEKLAFITDAAQLLGPTLDPVDPKPDPSDEEIVASLRKTAKALAGAGEKAGAEGQRARRLAVAFATMADAAPERRQQMAEAMVPGLKTMLGLLRSALSAEPVAREQLPADLVSDWVAADGRARIEVSPKGDANDNAVLERFVAAVGPRGPGCPRGAPPLPEKPR
jgi:hopanoid biosynthesis associated RND transporter like protein HpnN